MNSCLLCTTGRFSSCTVLLTLTLLFGSSISAQDLDSVTIRGSVTDMNGAVIPGANVEASLTKTGIRRASVADELGRYRLLQLEPGIYAIKVTAAGFEPATRSDVTTVAGQNVQLDIQLLPAGVRV